MTRVLIGLLSMCVAVAASAGVNSWTPVGPDGGSVRSVAYHPTIPDLVFAVTIKSIYRSEDGGQSWSSVLEDNALNLGKIVIDRADPDRILVVGFGTLFRSSDGGASFVFENTPGIFSNLAIAADGSVLYALENDADPRFFTSADFGATWEVRAGTGLLSGTFISEFAVAPQDPNELYVLYASQGVFRSADGGENWTQQSSLSTLGSAAFAIDPADSTRLLLATTNQGLMSSADSGATWTQELTDDYFWVGYHPQATGGEAIAISPDGAIVRRQGDGMAWETGQALKLNEVRNGDFDPQNADPFNSTLMISTDEGPLLTTDGGVTFTALGQGMRSANVTDIAAAQDGSDTVYVAYSSGPIGLYRRSAGVWSAVNNDVLRTNVEQPISIRAQVAIAPDDPSRVFFSSGNSVVDSSDAGQSWTMPHPHFGTNFRFPRELAFAPSNAQVIYASTDAAGVRRSVDQGANWQAVTTGLPDFIGSIAVDPTNPDIVYAGTAPAAGDPAIFRTDDGGASWNPIVTGFAAQNADALAIDPLNPATVFAGGTGDAQGVFVSTDSGQAWNRVGLPAGEDQGLSIVVDPVVPTTLVMAADANSDAARSVDGGATWESLPFGRAGSNIRRVALDAGNPHVILAAASNYGLIEFEVSPDLEASFLSVPSTLVLDGSDTVSVRVTNHGPFAASAATLVLDLPPGTSISSATPAQGSCTIASPSMSCAFGALQVGASIDADFTIVGDAMASSGTLTATAGAHESDSDTANDAVSATIESVRTADLAVTLSADNDIVNNGDTVMLTAVVSNQGPNDTTTAELALALDAGLTFVSATPGQGSCAESGGTVTCQLAAIANGADVTVTVETTAAAQGALSSTATIADASVLDGNAADDSAASELTVLPTADISVALASEPSEAVSGRSVQYRFTIANAGPDDLQNAEVAIQISGATFDSASLGSAGSCSLSGSTATCTVDSLASGGSAAATVNLTAGNSGGNLSVTATASFVGQDMATGNDRATASITVTAPPSSGGGGGAFGLLELLMLAAFMLYWRSRRELHVSH